MSKKREEVNCVPLSVVSVKESMRAKLLALVLCFAIIHVSLAVAKDDGG